MMMRLLLTFMLLWSLLQAEGSTQLEQGAELYRFYCAACHGPQGGGLAEARLAFPEDHQRCERCHRPNNPPRMSLESVTPRNAFNVGTAPSLRGLAHFGTAAGLYAYLRATMPRQAPASLSDDDYLAITAFLLSLGDLPLPSSLDEEGAARIRLSP